MIVDELKKHLSIMSITLTINKIPNYLKESSESIFSDNSLKMS